MVITTLDQLQTSLQKTKQYIDGEITEVNATIPTNNNQLTNGAGYQTESDVKAVVADSFQDGIDATLSTTGRAADAKATGDAIQAVQDDVANSILPSAPTSDGNYVLTVTVTDGMPTYSWTLQA